MSPRRLLRQVTQDRRQAKRNTGMTADFACPRFLPAAKRDRRQSQQCAIHFAAMALQIVQRWHGVVVEIEPPGLEHVGESGNRQRTIGNCCHKGSRDRIGRSLPRAPAAYHLSPPLKANFPKRGLRYDGTYAPDLMEKRVQGMDVSARLLGCKQAGQPRRPVIGSQQIFSRGEASLPFGYT